MNPHKFHFFKMEYYDGKWKTFYNPSQNRLKKLIQKIQPKNIYISLNKFLYYKEHGKSYRHENKLLERFGLIDIDGQDFNNKEECEQYFKNIIQILSNYQINIKEIIKTNNKVGGFQIVINSKSYDNFIDLLKDCPYLFDKIDRRVFDEKRVKRPPFISLNGNKDSYSIPLFSEHSPSVKNHPQRILGYAQISKYLNISNNLTNELSPLFPNHTIGVDMVGFHTLGMPQIMQNKLKHPLEPVVAGKPSKVAFVSQDNLEADDNRLAEMRNPSSTTQQGRQAIKSPLPSSYLVKEIKSNVYGTKLLIPFIKLLTKPSRRLIKRLQKTYSIGDLYLFNNHSNYALISPKCCQMRRLEKIYSFARSSRSLFELKRQNFNWMTISNVYSIEERKSLKTFEFMDVFESDVNGQYSMGHIQWLGKYYQKEYGNIIGNKLKIYVAEFRRD